MGGLVARGAGWTVIAIGLIITTLLTGFFGLAFGGAAITWIVFILGLASTGAFGGLLVASGKKLASSGTDARRFAREKALLALAGNRGGTVTALDASRSLDISIAEASEFLTAMAKRVPDEVAVDIDDEGALLYTFVHAKAESRRSGPPPSVNPYGGPAYEDHRVRVDDGLYGAVAPGQAQQEPIDAEFEPDPLDTARKSRSVR